MLRFMRVAVLVVAVLIVALGSSLGGLGIISSLSNPDAGLLLGITGGVALLALTAGLGLALARQARQAIKGRGSNPFRPGRVWPLVLVFLLALAFGQAILTLDLLPALTFPPLHVLASVLPSVIILGLAGRSLAGLTRWRDIVLQTSSGAFLATAISFVLEIVAGLALIFVAYTVLATQPGGQELLGSLEDQLKSPGGLADPAFLSSVAQSPIVIAVALLALAVVVPLVEEATKTLGIGLMAYRRITMAQAFLWGVAGGAGFSLAEGLLSTLSGLDGWVVAMLSRIGATMLHCLAGGLMGLAWYHVLSQQRWGRGLKLYAASVGLHGVWNALAGGLTLLSLRVTDTTPVAAGQEWIEPAFFVILALLGIMAIAVTVGLVRLTRRVRLQSATVV